MGKLLRSLRPWWISGGLLLLSLLFFWRPFEGRYKSEESRQLIAAIVAHDLPAVRQALDQGADPNFASAPDRSIPDSLMLRLSSFCFWNPRVMSGARRQIAFRDDTPLALAVRQGQVDTVRLLLTRGARANLPVREGITPLMIAVNTTGQSSTASEAIAAQLLQAGADPNATATAYRGSYPPTPLRMAVFSAHPAPMVRLLLAAGATPRDPDTRAQLARMHLVPAASTK